MTSLQRLQNDLLLCKAFTTSTSKDIAIKSYLETETNKDNVSFINSIKSFAPDVIYSMVSLYRKEIEQPTIAETILAENDRTGFLFETEEGSFQYAGIDEHGNHKFTKFGSNKLVDLDINQKCRAIF